MKKEISLLNKGIFNSPKLDTKVKTRAVSKKEKILGHFVGPLGLIFVVNTIAALVEKFFTQQVGLMYGEGEASVAMGNTYGIVMTVAKILAIGLGLLNGWLLSHTKCKHGRMRPWYLIFGFVSIIIGALIFLFPGNTLGEAYWYYFFFLLVCYNTVGCSYFHLFRENIVSLSTRDPVEKNQLTFIRKMSWTLVSGIIIGMLVSSVLLPYWLDHDIMGYPIIMIALSVVAIPLLLLEYFYTRERIVEDVATEVGVENENKVPLKQQMKALFSNKYYVILTILATLSGIADNFKGGNVQFFYIKFLLGGAENPGMNMIYQIITGVPLGLGAIIAYPLGKKFGVKNVTWIGFSCVLGGSILGWIFADNLVVAMIAGFIRQMGFIPNAYILASLICFAFDSVEYKSGFRLEGLLGVAIVVAIQAAIYAPFAGGYESALLKLGFVDNATYVPTETVKNFMSMAFYLFDIILAAAYVILLPFIDVEKKLPEINAELLRRKKEAVLARGEEWIEPEEEIRLEREKADREREENRIADLRDYCTKKGLNFEEENEKYLQKKAEKDRKWAEKQAAKQAKKDAMAAKKKK